MTSDDPAHASTLPPSAVLRPALDLLVRGQVDHSLRAANAEWAFRDALDALGAIQVHALAAMKAPDARSRERSLDAILALAANVRGDR